MSVLRRVRSSTVRPSAAPRQTDAVEEYIIYRGYRIEPGSYGVSTASWSPRVVVSVRTDGAWLRLTPLYSLKTTRFPTRAAADDSAVELARVWIDRAVEQPG